MTPDDRDLLIHRHLEGALSEADAAALGALIKGDAGFRRRLAEMAFERAQMKDILSAAATEAVPVLAAPRVPRRAILPMAAAAIIVVSVGIAVAMWSFREQPGTNLATPGPGIKPEPDTPKDPYRGFAGPVAFRVVNRTENSLSLLVLSVPGQAPAHPLVGNVIQVGAGYSKNPRGEWSLDGAHAAFIRKLDRDQEDTLDVRHQKDDFFLVGELTPAQLKWARSREDAPPKRAPERPRKEAGKEGTRDGADKEGSPKDRPKEEE